MQVIRDGPYAKCFWDNTKAHDLFHDFYSLDLCSWLDKNAANTSTWHVLNVPWNMFFSFAIWILWLHRNKVVFKGSFPNCELGKEVQAMASEFLFCAARSAVVRRKRVTKVRWNKPALGWYKLNIDGSSLDNSRLASGGSFIRDHNGAWIKGSSHAIGVSTSVNVELWALREGLLMCRNLNLVAIEIELDAKVVVGWISEEYNSNLQHAAFILICRTLIS